jgi:multidrug resistance efflux pump
LAVVLVLATVGAATAVDAAVGSAGAGSAVESGTVAPLPAAVDVPNCLVVLVEEAQVPAQEPGVVTQVKVREGQLVEQGQLLAQIDDAKAKMALRVGVAKLAAAKEKADDDINVRYAISAAKVAKAEYDVSAEANRKVPRSVPQVELNKLLLKHEETVLGIEKSRLDQRVAVDEASVAQADADAAQEDINRRQIRSPVEGVVDELHRHVGEWALAGDPVLHVVRMDRLWVEGFISAKDFNRSELQQRPVKVEIMLARGEVETITGTVVFTKPNTEAGGTFLIRAEIKNQKQNGYWMLSPGLSAKMHISLR